MSHCAPLPVRVVTITHLADEAGLMRPTGARARPVWAARRTAWIRSRRVHTSFALAKCGSLLSVELVGISRFWIRPYPAAVTWT
jgi:hypothetical protein